MNENNSIFSNTFFLSIISGLLGSIIGSLVTSFFTYKVMLKEKRYYIDIQIISERIISPLIDIIQRLELRGSGFAQLVPDQIYTEINEVFKHNSMWLLCSNNEIFQILTAIREYSINRNCDKLVPALKELLNVTQNRLKVYKVD